ncbi:DNA annealing helicase and endonuclease ZRANB3-like isoform X2 [Haplochromis burtoni]|uniref:DNA annealing helicase and endonuclease ZRANB3-like isoform X2 n=1 Tax=Haplochromis burtoni TaxID=8153 RepID=UPI001C2D59F4|nr:DNA annealing helicase and endonuclease ZRANB3-like isoform X2 [Haplochromis burtoni]
MVLPLEGSTGNAKTDVFFTHFEKEKQHDIRSFFSPQAGKTKRKRTEDEESPSISSETAATPAGIRVYLENSEEGNEESCSQTSKTPDRDFSPQLKRLRTPQPNRSPTSRFGGKRRSSAGGISAGRPASAVSLTSQPSEPDPASVWNCGACTYSNSSLLPYCEMCECPRSTSAVSSDDKDTV